MPKAIWNGVVLAQSENGVSLEGNYYFPPESIQREYFKESGHTTLCPWKGTASYYDIIVNGQTNPASAWYYPNPKEAAKEISGYIAFWKGVKVEN